MTNIDSVSIITMETTKIGKFTMYIAGTGTVSIDWGNGSVIENRNLYAWDENLDDLYEDIFAFVCNYSNASTNSITITGNNITHLLCDENNISALDVSKYADLIYLTCSRNQLSTLNLNNNIALKNLNCCDNQLVDLDISNNINLSTLYCTGNQLTNLDIRKNTNLFVLCCESIKMLDINNNSKHCRVFFNYEQ